MTEEQDFCSGSEITHPPSDLEPVQARQTDVEQDQIRMQLFGLFDGLQPIRSLRDLKLRPLLQRRADKSAEVFKVIDYQYLERLNRTRDPRWS